MGVAVGVFVAQRPLAGVDGVPVVVGGGPTHEEFGTMAGDPPPGQIKLHWPAVGWEHVCASSAHSQQSLGPGVFVPVGVIVGVEVRVSVGVFVGVSVGGLVGVSVFVGVLVGVGVGSTTVVSPEPVPVPCTMFTEATPRTRPSWSVCNPGAFDPSFVGFLRTSTKKLIVQPVIAPVPIGASTTGEFGMNSTSPVVGSGAPIVNVVPAHAVPGMPVAGPLTRKTPGSSLPAGQGTGVSVPHDGVCRMRLSVSVPVPSADVEVLVMLRPTGTLVSPT